jgi:hypothetical protein
VRTHVFPLWRDLREEILQEIDTLLDIVAWMKDALMPFLTRDEHDELFIALTRALKGENE